MKYVLKYVHNINIHSIENTNLVFLSFLFTSIFCYYFFFSFLFSAKSAEYLLQSATQRAMINVFIKISKKYRDRNCFGYLGWPRDRKSNKLNIRFCQIHSRNRRKCTEHNQTAGSDVQPYYIIIFVFIINVILMTMLVHRGQKIVYSFPVEI